MKQNRLELLDFLCSLNKPFSVSSDDYGTTFEFNKNRFTFYETFLDNGEVNKEKTYLKSGQLQKISKKSLEEGFRHIHIWEYEWCFFNDSTKNFIKSLLDNHKEAVEFKEVREVDPKECQEFLDKYHLFHHYGDKLVIASVRLGLYDTNNVLRAVACFKKKARNWDWARFVSDETILKDNKYKADLLFEYFRDNYLVNSDVKQVLDYQQLERFFDSNNYSSKRMGFKLLRTNAGGCYVSKTKIERHKFHGIKLGTEEAKKFNLTRDVSGDEAATLYMGDNVFIENVGTGTWGYKVD